MCSSGIRSGHSGNSRCIKSSGESEATWRRKAEVPGIGFGKGAVATLALIGDLSIRISGDNFLHHSTQFLVEIISTDYYLALYKKSEAGRLP
jgi:hypothetical protein